MRFRSRRATLFLAFTLFAVVANARQDCAEDFAHMAQVKFGPKNGATNGFVFKNEKMIFGREISLEFGAVPHKKFAAKFTKISDEDKYMREHLKRLKRASLPNAGTSREMQEFIVIYRDGSRKSVRYTSNEMHQISEDAGNIAIEKSGIFTEDIQTIIDIHTHPNLQRRSDLFFTSDDVSGSRNMKAQIERALRRRIDYQVILLPTCEACEDVMLTTSF